MSTQHHSLAVTLESIHVLTVDTTGARNITRDATPANLSGQGDGIQSALAGTFINAAGWTNVLSEVRLLFTRHICASELVLMQMHAPDAALSNALRGVRRVVADFTIFVTLYADLMAALAEQRDLLISPGSPFAPDGAVVGQLITVLHFAIWALHTWLRSFSPTRVAEIRAQWERAAAAFELAASQYPRPGKSRAELVKTVCGNLKITVLEAPTQD
ncbi:hypothetical protein C2E23DRAFT_882247 [Lenzites betulinus]|nr:hypothetical protein C2E23DRAFT_882247 [Lenzites betulinus]